MNFNNDNLDDVVVYDYNTEKFPMIGKMKWRQRRKQKKNTAVVMYNIKC